MKLFMKGPISPGGDAECHQGRGSEQGSSFAIHTLHSSLKNCPLKDLKYSCKIPQGILQIHIELEELSPHHSQADC